MPLPEIYTDLFSIIPTEFRVFVAAFMIMSLIRVVTKIILEVVDLGYIPPEIGAPKLNLDKFGLPQDYASYMWVLYKKVVNDESPNRRAFLQVVKPIQPKRLNPTLVEAR